MPAPGEIFFPVQGESQFDDSWGDPRGRSRRHTGTDLMASKRTPVRAVAAGEVSWVHDGGRRPCCAVEILHPDGYRSRYIHLDNDTPGTDDGLGFGLAPGIRERATVQAGELVGWVGDSGSAEATAPHLHFELLDPRGGSINPYPALAWLRARQGYSGTIASWIEAAAAAEAEPVPARVPGTPRFARAGAAAVAARPPAL
jgi:murein DD-endopeptidase MepM/ murein hydrolase activator NlpD